MSEPVNCAISRVRVGLDSRGMGRPVIDIRFSGEAWTQSVGETLLDGCHMSAWTVGILTALEAETFEELLGRVVRIRRDSEAYNARIISVGHPVKDKWFAFDTAPEIER